MKKRLKKFKNSKRKAFVLVSVMMMGVLLISCATAFAWFVRMQIRSVGQERDALAKRSLALVLVNSVMGVLTEINGDYDSPTQRWFQPFIIPFEDLGIWVLTVSPLDDKIPIRNLFLPDGNTIRHEFEAPFQKMLDKVGARNAELPILDFFDRNNKPRVGGMEREDFINRGPYDISELLMLDPLITQKNLYGNGADLGIADYCTVFSEGKININVAPVHVLELLPGLDERGLAERISQVRQEEPITSFKDIQNLPGASPRTSTLLTNLIGFKSRYFQIKIESLMDDGSQGGTSFNIIFDKSTRHIVKWEES